MKRAYKKYNNVDKVSVIRRHLIEQVPVSELCEELKLSPAQYYQWQKQFFENGAAAFEGGKRAESKDKRLTEELTRLEKKLEQRNEVVTELMTEHMALKKSLGET